MKTCAVCEEQIMGKATVFDKYDLCTDCASLNWESFEELEKICEKPPTKVSI